MRRQSERGFSFVEVLVALAILMVASAPLFWICAGAQRLTRSQSEAGDLQQRARVLAEKLQRDLVMAGAGPPHGSGVRLVDLIAPIVPARVGFRLADSETSAFSDRVSILYVPPDGWDAALAVPMPSALAPVPVDPSARGCPSAGWCGFTADTRALVVDTRAAGAGHELFTVTATVDNLAHDAPNTPFSQPYAPPSARVMPIVQRTYYFDRANRRLMLYDGYLSDVPLLDRVADVRFQYFSDSPGAIGLQPLTLPQLSDGPFLGLPPNRFDQDLQSIRLVRATIRLEADADDVRGAAGWFSRPGRSTSGFSLVPDFEVTFDVAPRNMRVRR